MKITFKTILDTLDSIPLSTTQLKHLSRVDSLIPFHELGNYKTLEDLFNTLGNKILVIILADEHTGHFGYLGKQNNLSCIFFESYGIDLDNLLQRFPYTMELTHGVNVLKSIAENSNMTVDYNRYQLQSYNSTVEDCGYHVSSRSRFNSLSNLQYFNLIKSININSDDLIILLQFLDIIDLKIGMM